jgi:uncharacterized protein YndB with AHSA1/START domain
MNTPDTRSLVVERQMPHPPEKVWRALTETALLEDWMMKNDFEAVVGKKFTFRAKPAPNWSGLVEGQVLSVEPKRQLSYTWGLGGDDASSGMNWVVTWTLTPTQEGTLLRMEQSGFRADQEAAYQGANYGWQRWFGSLEQMLGGLA